MKVGKLAANVVFPACFLRNIDILDKTGDY